MSLVVYVIILIFGMGGPSQAQSPSLSKPLKNTPRVFRLSLTESVKNFDPHLQRSSSGQYINQQLFRNFYRLDDKNNYVSDLGETCEKTKSRWVCTLKKDLKWSDGRDLTAEDFALSWARVLTLPAPRADLLFSIKNAKAVYDKTKPVKELGIKALSPRQFEILWEKDSPGFEFLLMSPLLVPLPKGEFAPDVFSGPYKMVSKSSVKLRMDPNPYYPVHNNRPDLEWLLFDENLALEAYKRGELDFIRRIPTSMIPQFEKQDGYRLLPTIRLDSLVFGPSLFRNPQLRQDLIRSLNFEDLQKLFNSPSRPGCFGLPVEFYGEPELCYAYPPGENLKQYPQTQLKMVYSSLGAEDHRRLAEWLQSQWSKKLGIKLLPQGLENKIFLQRIIENPPDIFRRGLSPENPSCFGILESFTKGHPDNYAQFSDPVFDDLVMKMKTQNLESARRNCRKALQILLEANRMIPTGRILFSVMVRPGWKRVRFNALNHMDLSELSP